jgi:50S ribosomal subunit-associated GTPase HflX
VLNSIFKNGARPPMLNVLNKIDRLQTSEDRQRLEEACQTIPNVVVISARERMGIEELKGQIARCLLEGAAASISGDGCLQREQQRF